MIIESSNQVPRVTLLKRFPVPRNFKVTPQSRIEKGRKWAAPAGASRTKANTSTRAALGVIEA